VWVLFLNENGTVRDYQKISDTQGGFDGILEDSDSFGASVAALGDLNGDGISDLAVGAQLDDDGGDAHGAVWVLFLDTDGTVKGHLKISDTEGGVDGTLDDDDRFGTRQGGLGDLDGDGIGDLAVAAIHDDDGGMNRGAVWVLFLDGMSAIDFDDPQWYAAAGAATREDTGDLNGDQLADVVIAIPGDPKVNGEIQVFLNQGNDQDDLWLGLLASEPDAVGTQPSGIAVDFLDGDTDLDVAVTNAGDDTVTVLFNAGDGSFPTSADITVGSQPSAVATGNYYGDGKADLVVANEGDNTVWVLDGDGTGGFVHVDTIPTLGLDPRAVDPSDVDEDKDPDIVAINGLYGGGPSGSVFVIRNQGGVFDPAVNYPVGNNPVDLATGDLDRDGFADIAAVNLDDDTVSLLVNQGNGTFDAAVVLEVEVGQAPLAIEIVDLDGDLDGDLAVVAMDSVIGPAVQVFQNLGQAVGELLFDEAVAYSVQANPNYVVSDVINIDSLADLVTVNEDFVRASGSVTVLLNSPLAPACPWDVAGNDDLTGVNDFLIVLAWWGTDPGGPPDFDNDGTVGVLDFLTLLAHWGPCP
jgi:hypothetical protein